jgi:low temperature requirement protein LtrA
LGRKLLAFPEFHQSGSGHEKKASWLELFYDLMYVASFIQLGNAFAEDISLLTFVKTCLVFLALWTCWTGFTYFSNRYNVDDYFHRIMVFVHMFAVATMTILIPQVMSGQIVFFSLAFAFAQFLVAMMYFIVSLQNKFGIEYTKYWCKVFFLSGLLWAIAPLFTISVVPYIWVAGILVVVLSPFMKKARALACEIPFDLEHLSERYGLLTIIVLGESFVKVLSELVAKGNGEVLIVQACFALLITCSIWWIYFDDVAHAELKDEETSMPVWLLSHIPLQLGLIFMGVGIKKAVIYDFGSTLPEKYALLLSMAIAMILLCIAVIDLVINHEATLNKIRVTMRIVSAVLCIVVGFSSAYMNNLTVLTSLLSLVILQIIVDVCFSLKLKTAE